MSYQDHFVLTDEVVSHLDTIVGSISDPFITSRYVGFVSVAAVTVYELAIKDIFLDFGNKKHPVLGTFTRNYFDRINGRIRIQIIRDDYVRRFGEKYTKKFREKLENAERESLRKRAISIKNSYENIITWRNEFAHGGRLPSTATYVEVTQAYQIGKEVIHCLAKSMYR